MKMTTIKVVSTQNDAILGQQPSVIEISVSTSKINRPKNNKKSKKFATHKKSMNQNRLYRETETKIVSTDIETNTDVKAVKETRIETGEYTDSNQITKKRKARASKKRAIQSARRTGREFKEKIQGITSSQTTDGVTDKIDEMLEEFDLRRTALSVKVTEHQK
jgi:hypothetical protein